MIQSRGFSRTMPSAEEVIIAAPPRTLFDHLVVGLLLSPTLAFIVYIVIDLDRLVFTLAFLSIIFAIGYWVNRRLDARLHALAQTRADESICTFARDFDCHYVDPWIVRATWEELQVYLGTDKPFPIRASDSLEHDYYIDLEDAYDLWQIISRRAGRSIEHTEHNPLYSEVATVGDLVRFTNVQPRM
ncbi:MAG: hypothetical protein RhofKO_33660 [Rhodothermales bacterium]